MCLHIDVTSLQHGAWACLVTVGGSVATCKLHSQSWEPQASSNHRVVVLLITLYMENIIKHINTKAVFDNLHCKKHWGKTVDIIQGISSKLESVAVGNTLLQLQQQETPHIK